MTPKRDRIRIEVYPSADDGRTGTDSLAIANEAILAIARLIGRQMAREQFERGRSRERKPLRQIKNGESS